MPEDQLLVGMTGATAFEVDSDVIKPGFYSTLDKIAGILNRYGKTQLVIVGHTDNTGSDQHNQQLSERRAGAVNQYLLNKGVIPERLSAYGRGKSEPIASNATPEGKQQNRRVDITIIPVVAN
jgi:outer membrane protein OmpA-like peptidoglycan-associated protein